MNSQPTSFLYEVLSEAPISVGKQAYFRERLKGNFHEKMVNLFREKEASGEITRAKLARKIGKRPEQITRILNSSGNLSLNTISDIILGMGCEPEILIRDIEKSPRNFNQPDWLCSSSPLKLVISPQLYPNTTTGSTSPSVKMLEQQL
jgi:DNA-binding phage protein